MANSTFKFDFKEDNTNEDYQKILIHQNHAIIRLLTITTNPLEVPFRNLVVDEYSKKISPFVQIKGQPKSFKNLPPLSERKQKLLQQFLKRRANGEDISEQAANLGLTDYLKQS
jgi:hypothetical protein